LDFRDHADRILKKAMSSMGTEAKFYPKKEGGIFNVRGVFDSKYQVVDPETQEIVSTNKPGLGVNLNDFTVIPVQGDEFEIRGTRFVVTDKQEDGQGGAVLLLNKVKASDRIEYARSRS
jgi:hypothetical protein